MKIFKYFILLSPLILSACFPNMGEEESLSQASLTSSNVSFDSGNYYIQLAGKCPSSTQTVWLSVDDSDFTALSSGSTPSAGQAVASCSGGVLSINYGVSDTTPKTYEFKMRVSTSDGRMGRVVPMDVAFVGAIDSVIVTINPAPYGATPNISECSGVTVIATALDDATNLVTSYTDSNPSWSSTVTVKSPSQPAPFVNGISITRNVQFSGTGSAVLTVTTGGVNGVSAASTVVTPSISFAGAGFFNYFLDNSYTLFWAPSFEGCTNTNQYTVLSDVASGGPWGTTHTTTSATKYSNTLGVGNSLYYVTQDSVALTNSDEVQLSDQTLRLATLAGARDIHEQSPLSGAIRPIDVDFDVYGNLIFFNGAENNHSVGTLCLNNEGSCLGRTLGATYALSGSGTALPSTTAALDFDVHGLNFSYQKDVNGVEVDPQGNIHVYQTHTNYGEHTITCQNNQGLCATVNNSGLYDVDYTGGGSAAKVGRVYTGGIHTSDDIVAMAFDMHGNQFFYESGAGEIKAICTTTSGWCARVVGGSLDRDTTDGAPTAATIGTEYFVAGGLGGGEDNTSDPLAAGDVDVVAMTFDQHNNLLILDQQNSTVRVMCYEVEAGVCSRTAAGSVLASGGAQGSEGFFYKIAGNGGGYADGVDAQTTTFNGFTDIKVDSANNYIVADYGNYTARVICNSSKGLCENVSGSNIAASGSVGSVGSIYKLAGTQSQKAELSGEYTGDGGVATSARVNVGRLAVDRYDNVVISETIKSSGYSHTVRRMVARIVCHSTSGLCGNINGTTVDVASPLGVATAGNIYRVLGDFSVTAPSGVVDAPQMTLWNPTAVAVDGAGNFLVANRGANKINVICKSTGGGLCDNVSGDAISFTGADPDGTQNKVYTLTGTGWYANSGDNGASTSAAFRNPQGLAVDSAGNIIIADADDHKIRVVCAGVGGICTDSDGTGQIDPSGGSGITAGAVYTLAGTGNAGNANDGGLANLAELSSPVAVAVTSNDNVVIADKGNHAVRIVCSGTAGLCSGFSAGDIETIAGILGTAGDGADDSAANTVAIDTPTGVAVDSLNNVAIADNGNNKVRVVCTSTTLGICSTVSPSFAGNMMVAAGTGTSGSTYNGTSATAANIQVQGVGFDKDNNHLIISDSSNSAVGIVCRSTAGVCATQTAGRITPTGAATSAGNLYLLAGTVGSSIYSGEGAVASTGSLTSPVHAIVDSDDRVLIVDSSGNRIRMTNTAP